MTAIRCGGETGEGCGTILSHIDEACPNCLPNFYGSPPLPEAVYRELHPHSAELYMAGVRDGEARASSPRPLDVERLAEAMHEIAYTAPCWNHCEGDNLDLHRKVATDLAAEYARLSDPDTRTGE